MGHFFSRVASRAVGMFALPVGLLAILSLGGCNGSLSSLNHQAEPGPAPENLYRIEPKELAEYGEYIAFGTTDLGSKRVLIGKGECPLCHTLVPGLISDRGPGLLGIETTSRQRVKEERYRMFARRYAAKGEPATGIRPHARTGGEYLIESLYCPNCYIMEGQAVTGTGGLESPMPVVNHATVGLTDLEIVAVVAYLQSKDTPGDYSRVTAKRDWERYFGRDLRVSFKNPVVELPPRPGLDRGLMALAEDTPEQIVWKMGCLLCHRIPKVRSPSMSEDGPLLILKESAERRIRSPEYLQRVREGKAHARTPKEYVVESILHPDAFIVPGFENTMASASAAFDDYSRRFTVAGLDKLVDFLMTLDADAARKEGMDRTPAEKEGSLLK